jgi:hypothetical protein
MLPSAVPLFLFHRPQRHCGMSGNHFNDRSCRSALNRSLPHAPCRPDGRGVVHRATVQTSARRVLRPQVGRSGVHSGVLASVYRALQPYRQEREGLHASFSQSSWVSNLPEEKPSRGSNSKRSEDAKRRVQARHRAGLRNGLGCGGWTPAEVIKVNRLKDKPGRPCPGNHRAAQKSPARRGLHAGLFQTRIRLIPPASGSARPRPRRAPPSPGRRSAAPRCTGSGP